MEKRPENVKHYSECLAKELAYYEESDETFGISANFTKAFGLEKLGIHFEILPPHTRSSFPHAEKDEEEFVYVLQGHPDLWQDGRLYGLSPGDAVGWPAGTGISHTLINNSDDPVHLLVAGEKSKPHSKVFYPLNSSRRERIGDRWWEVETSKNFGAHDGRPKKAKPC